MLLLSYAFWTAFKELKNSRTKVPKLEETTPILRGAFACWGSIRKYIGDLNVSDTSKKNAIEKHIITMILRSDLSLGFGENIHFQNLIEVLCPVYAKFNNSYPDAYL